ncbi:DUF1684 domain-containing protein [Marinoscillum furvescens]|uniref:DUF1684 domain-containing protein n=1 Tax=Marinoscillum furvescens DSM 4134 TaxID=1122208 RepID=A0A3D9L2R7_MARFU|nr:DUF1684 domain-containing protein [Marinoscillum furvescens]RED96674.1 hypothetical protein C7460_114132 [Marinoscillum furvescens DSM 4134]
MTLRRLTNYILITLIISTCQVTIAQTDNSEDYVQSIKEWQEELNDSYKDPEESPLPKKARKKFKGLDYFPIAPKYRVEAILELTPDAEPFMMPTTSGTKPIYVKYGIATFEIDGQSFQLSLYQNLQLKTTEEYADYLFAPFTDLTSGNESYGGGRYMDLRMQDTPGTIILDFNKSYNPYCAYSDNYSCPIPPRENDLALEIKAGVKAWKK